MKTFNVIFCSSLAFFFAIILAFKPATSDCDYATLSNQFQMADYMTTRLKNDTTVYIFKKNASDEKTSDLFFKGKKIESYDFNAKTDTKIEKMDTTTNKKLFELVIGYEMGANRKSFFFINGIEIKTLLPDMPPYPFRVKLYGKNKAIFCFEYYDKGTPVISYGSLDLSSNKFCKTN